MSFANPCGPSSDQPWIADLSWMTNRYEPAFNVLTVLPFCFRSIVKPGPSVPVIVGVVARAPSELETNTAEAPIRAMRTKDVRMGQSLPFADGRGTEGDARWIVLRSVAQ